MALPSEILLTTVEYMKKITAVNGAVDDNVILPSMYVAQDKFVSPYLGDNLYAAIKTKIQGGTLTGNYLTLVDQYCAKPIVFWTLVELIPKMTYRYDNGTLGQHQSEDYQPISDSIMKDEIARARSNAEYYTENLIRYLCDNSSLFPEYTTQTGSQRAPRKKVYHQTTFQFTRQLDAMGHAKNDVNWPNCR